MTTLVGIEAYQGERGVVLASDMNMTHTSWKPQGDIAYREQRIIETPKIYINDDKNAAMCMTGTYDARWTKFLAEFLSGKFDFEKIVEEEFFPDLMNLNLNRWQGRVPTDDTSALLIATTLGKKKVPSLLTCYPLGKTEGRTFTSIGSGSQYAIKHINESGKIIPYRIDVDEGVDLAVGALEQASQDPYTGGLELVVVRKGEIINLGEKIKKEMDDTKAKAITKAIVSLRKKRK